MYPITIPGVVINAVVFAVLFPLLMRVFARKWIGWSGTLIAVVIYVAVGSLIAYTDILGRLHIFAS